MSNPDRILFAGDTHGNLQHCGWIAQRAVERYADMIVQVGDLGWWDHTASGRQFLDDLAVIARRDYVPWVFVDGNHDNIAQLDDYSRDSDGFIIVRPGIRYAPRGHVWTWANTTFLAAGGAYSIDKLWRLKREATLSKVYRRNMCGELWFPQEEMVDGDVTRILSDTGSVDVIVSHDKPRAATPAPDWHDLPDCLPNQDRIMRLVTALQPSLLVHGHLHHRYTDTIRSGGDTWTRVEGLGADVSTRPDDSILLLTLPLETP